MRLTQIFETMHGFGTSLSVAFVICASFTAGTGFERLQRPNRMQTAREAALYQDFGELGKYRADDHALAPDPNRVVFLGDSITYYWNFGASFPDKHYINRGIDRQTTSQMLVRFRQDVVELKPAAVVILAGTNDLGDTSAAPTSIPDIERNLQTMAELAEVHHIRPLFASVLPVHNRTFAAAISALRTPKKILAINAWLKDFCAAHGYTYVDYHSALVSADGMLRAEFSDDGIHPNEAGHRIMAAVAKAALEQALATGP